MTGLRLFRLKNQMLDQLRTTIDTNSPLFIAAGCS